MNWRSIPFVRLLFPLAAGIYLGDRFGTLLGAPGWEAAWCIALLWMGCRHRRPLPFRWRRAYGIVLFLLLLSFGAWIVQRSDPRTRPTHFGHHLDASPAVEGLIREAVPSSRGWRVLLQVDGVAAAGRRLAATGKLLVYLPAAPPPRPGGRIHCRSRIDSLAPPRNPNAFDFARYQAVRGIYHVSYARPGECTPEPAAAADWRERARRWQQRGLAILRRHLGEGEAYGVAAALTLGYRQAVSDELRAAYQHSGAIHILAVSGLHVGMVYLVLATLLRILPAGRYRRAAQAALCLLGVWAFVLVTGCSPSAVRAGTMFSFFILGRAFYRQSNAFNTLAASACCLLLLQPRLLFDVGFQLSYVAVAGIIGLQPLLYRAWYLPHALPAYGWKLLSVSVAAQLGTLPLSLYYFHEFPTYFWLSGLIAVPAAGLILGGGLLLLLLDGVPVAGPFCGRLLGQGIALLNRTIDWIGDLPGGRVEGIWWEVPLVAGVYLCLVLLLLGWHLRERRCWLWALALLALLTVYQAFRYGKSIRRQQLTVYQVRDHSLIDVMNGRHCWSLTDDELTSRSEAYAAANHRLAGGVRSCRRLPGDAGTILLRIGGRTILLLHPDTPLASLPRRRVDIAVIRGDPAWSVAALQRRLRVGLLVFDASNARYRVDRWREECRRLGQPCLDIGKQGGQVIPLFSAPQ